MLHCILKTALFESPAEEVNLSSELGHGSSALVIEASYFHEYKSHCQVNFSYTWPWALNQSHLISMRDFQLTQWLQEWILGDISNPHLIYWPPWATFTAREKQFPKALLPPAHPDRSCLVPALAPSHSWVYASVPREPPRGIVMSLEAAFSLYIYIYIDINVFSQCLSLWGRGKI